ncbi:hypothetical protein LEP1GSC133_0389 [Leptospira borgpetersenii serovar Pomona str. 200901868]|uniref:Uncharacterized protein n=1 Tax=Leptospira borgpetersenii serovar Pomona str. 200901868 TaxID=1192866 RepID=M6WEH9_LEPBO|nr:hypothetical protein LEP1GSC133_0389 [Leptospira borgpetersenii serovar Pomona str. 200901868]
MEFKLITKLKKNMKNKLTPLSLKLRTCLNDNLQHSLST